MDCNLLHCNAEVAMSHVRSVSLDDLQSKQLMAKDCENNVNMLELQNHNDGSSEDDAILRCKRAKLDVNSVTDNEITECTIDAMDNSAEGVEVDAGEEYSKKYGADCQLEMLKTKLSYREHLTEMFFLQNGGNLVDYYVWKKRPNTLLACYIRSEDCDTDATFCIGDEGGVNAINGDCAALNVMQSIGSTPSVRCLDDITSSTKNLRFQSDASFVSCDSPMSGDISRNLWDTLSPSISVGAVEDVFSDTNQAQTSDYSIGHWCTSSPALTTLAGTTPVSSRMVHSFSTESFPNVLGGSGTGMFDSGATEGRNQETIAELARQEAEVKLLSLSL